MQIIEERGWLYNEVVEIYLGFSKVIEKCENLITEYDIAPESTYRKAYSMLTSEVERILLYCATCNTLLTIQYLEQKIKTQMHINPILYANTN